MLEIVIQLGELRLDPTAEIMKNDQVRHHGKIGDRELAANQELAWLKALKVAERGRRRFDQGRVDGLLVGRRVANLWTDDLVMEQGMYHLAEQLGARPRIQEERGAEFLEIGREQRGLRILALHVVNDGGRIGEPEAIFFDRRDQAGRADIAPG